LEKYGSAKTGRGVFSITNLSTGGRGNESTEVFQPIFFNHIGHIENIVEEKNHSSFPHNGYILF
jgi:hypothetical protein